MRSWRAALIGAVAAGVIALVLVVALTQLRPESGLVHLDRGEVPFDLLRNSAPAVRERPAVDEQLAPVFLVYQDALVAVQRPVPKQDASSALADALVAGPTDDEAARGVASLLRPDTDPTRVQIEGDVAVVDLRTPISPGAPSDRHLAIAQLVYTLTGIDGVRAVKFELDGKAAAVPVGNGTLTRSAVTRAEFPVQVLAVLP